MAYSLESTNAGAAFEGLSFLTVKSAALRGRADITFFIPEEAKKLTNVPLVILLHGAYGSHWNWAVMGGAHRTARRLVAEGKFPPVVLAMPSDGLWGDGSGYLIHREQDFEKWIVHDVPQATRTAASCVTVSSPVFLCGLSMGGFGAMRIGAKYPGFCRGISAHSSITHFDQLIKYVSEPAETFGTPLEDYGVLETMLRNRGTLPPLRFDCGVKDVLARYNRILHENLVQHGIAHQFHEFQGGHDWEYWSAHVVDSLIFFGEILQNKNHS